MEIIPDFLAIRTGGAGFIECRSDDELQALAGAAPERYVHESDGRSQCLPDLDLGPVVFDPSFKGRERMVEGSAEVGELIEGGRLDSAGVKMADYKSVAFGSSEGFSEHFVGDTIQGVVKILVPAAAVGELRQQGKGPTTRERMHKLTWFSMGVHHCPLTPDSGRQLLRNPMVCRSRLARHR